MAITYGPKGASFAVWQGERVVMSAKTEDKAREAAMQLAAAFGGEVRRREPEAKPTRAPMVAPPAPPLGGDVLALSIAKLRERLATGDLDEHLDALDAAERAGANRKGALDAIADRGRA